MCNKSKKKVLLISSRPLENSGITKIEMEIINECCQEIAIDISCAFGFDNKYGEALRQKNIECIALPTKKNVIKYMHAIKRLVKRHGYEKVYIHGNSAMMFFEALPSKMGGATVITHCHNTKSNFPIVHYLLKPFFSLTVDKKIGVSKIASSWAYMGKNIITIPNGVDLERFHYISKTRQKIRNELKWDAQCIIGHIGTFNRQKNHERLVSIFKEIFNRNSNSRLLLIGDGENKPAVQRQVEELGISDNVKFISHVDNPEDYLQAMDIMIMPSRHEGLCLSALEAQACGTPVLVSDIFAEETFVTPICKALPLVGEDSAWAKEALQMISPERIDTRPYFMEQKMEYSSMMNQIKSLLLA